MRTVWSEKCTAYLKEHHQEKTYREIAKDLGCSPSLVQQKAAWLGIKKNKNPPISEEDFKKNYKGQLLKALGMDVGW